MRALKRELDPRNLFGDNFNVDPSDTTRRPRHGGAWLDVPRQRTRDGWQPSGSGSAHRSAYENEGEDVSDPNREMALVSGTARGMALRSRSGRTDRAITEQQVFGRQALAASTSGGEVVD